MSFPPQGQATKADIIAHAALNTGVHGAGTDVLATDADIATHAALATVHQDASALAAALIATHAALATVHQDAPALIGTHKADANAHHQIAIGSYIGDGTDARQIITGFKCSVVVIQGELNNQWLLIPNRSIFHDDAATYHALAPFVVLHATDGFTVGDNSSYPFTANQDTKVYYYWAISE